MLEAVKVALDPTSAQKRKLASHTGAARFAFNARLAHVKDGIDNGLKPEWSYYALRKWWNASKDGLAVSGETGEPWWRENSKEAYNAGLESLAAALSNWSKSRNRQRKGRRVGFPRFKTKDGSVPRFAYTTGSFGLIDGDPKALRLPRIGRVHCLENVTARVGGAKVTRMTVSWHGGRWYASLTVDRPDPAPLPRKQRQTVGVDLGIKELATMSDGTVAHNPHALKRNLRRLRKAQKALSRKEKSSARRRKARLRVARLHGRVADLRRDAMDKLTHRLVVDYSEICIEDLNVAGMVRNHRLAQAVEDASFFEFRRQLEYKAARSGARVHVIDRFYPSSKKCSACGTVKAKLSLGERTFHCGRCGLELDRDLNAAINIMVAGSAPETLNAHGGDGRRPGFGWTTQAPVKCEPSHRASGVRLGAGVCKDAMQTKTN